MFLMEFWSGRLADMVSSRPPTSPQADLALSLISERSPACRKKIPIASWIKCSRTIEKKFSAFLLPFYFSAAITPFPYAIATLKLAALLFTVNPKSNSCASFPYNCCHNILRLFDVLPNFPLTTSKTMRDYYF